MKTKALNHLLCVFLLSLLNTFVVSGQQKNLSLPTNSVGRQSIKDPRIGDYTYRLYVTPNKTFGYDILRNGRLIFHQPSPAESVGDKQALFIKRLQAEKAAIIAIGKIKKGMRPQIIRDEIPIGLH